MAYNETKTRTWDRGTANDGQLFDAEFNRIYDLIANYIVANGGSAPSMTMTQLYGAIVPVGAILPYLPGYFANGSNGTFTDKSGSVTLAANFALCDGSAINDANSLIFNGAGRYIANLSDSRFLMGFTSFGLIGGSNDGHYHEMGTGADLNIGASGSHTHIYTDPGHVHRLDVSVGSGDEFPTLIPNTKGAYADTDSATTGITISASVHQHIASSFSGKIGLVTGGFDGNATGSNLPKYLTCKYVQRIK
jgi:hypothetical protein